MLGNALVPLVIALVVPLVLRWIASGSPPAGKPGVLLYSRRARMFALLFCVVPPLVLSVAALASGLKHPGDLASFLGLVLFFPALSLPLALEFYRVAIRFDAAGIQVASPWSRRRTLPWTEVRSVRWRKMAKWLDLAGTGGVVHVSPMLTGLDEFARACRASLAPELLADREAGSVLALLEQGRASELMWASEPPSRLVSGQRRSS
jgi:hypothetical protein